MKFLIAGLGNAGNEYTHTRHNIGFDVVNAFVQKHGGKFSAGRMAYVAEVKWKGKIFICICPTTYMNLSGNAVKYWLDKEKIALENLLVITDDVALPLSKMRLRPSGSDGGHNGLRSVEAVLLSRDYPRLRFGIGNDYPKGLQADFVLSKWKKEEVPLVKIKIEKAVEVIESFATRGISLTMNDVNRAEYTI
ncbi:MAG TPA: aminoacyl-tRNA hydrolase [Chitinophagaceae bacterium]|nr:aminoacyl-tRNA hydrolase [Chitinophagaceae bacterium]